MGPRNTPTTFCWEAVQEFLGYSPFELVFSRTVRGPLKLLKEGWLTEEPPTSLLDHVSAFRSRLAAIGELAQKNLKSAQHKMKLWYDRKAKLRKFNVGDKVLVLLPRDPPIMLKILPIMLCCTAQKLCLLCSNYAH